MSALPRLIALSPGDLDPGTMRPFLAALEMALEAGLPGLLLREPRLSDREYLALAHLVNEQRGRRAAWFAVHDRAHLAGELRADAVHLSFRSLRPGEVRAWLDPRIAIGLSTHAGDEPASWARADYLFHGPLHPTPAKPHALAPIGLSGLERAVGLVACPVLALGGVRPTDMGPLRERGLHGAAVLSGILGAEDPARATLAYLEALGEASE